MNDPRRARPARLTRRQFLRAGTSAAGAAGVGGSAALLSQRSLEAAEPKQSNPFAYDLGRHSKTDPKLIQYTELKRFQCPHGPGRRLAFGPDQRLYVAAGKYVSSFDRDGQALGQKALAADARAVAVAEDGTLYVSVRDHIEVFAPNQERATAWDTPGKRTWITGLAVAKNDLFAADSGGRVVLRYDRSGKIVGRLGERDRERDIPGLILPSPFLDVDIHPDGLLRINNPGRHRVEAYTVDGKLELAWGKPTAAIEGFCGCCNPVGLAFLPDGRIVTCEKGLPRVKVYSVDGQFESVVAGPESFLKNSRVGLGEGAADGVLSGLDVAADRHGRLYVLDLVTCEIAVFARRTAPPA